MAPHPPRSSPPACLARGPMPAVAAGGRQGDPAPHRPLGLDRPRCAFGRVVSALPRACASRTSCLANAGLRCAMSCVPASVGAPPAAGRPLKVRAAMLRLPAHGPGPGKGGASSAAVCAPAALSVHISIHAESVQVQNTPGATSPLNFECADLDASVYLHGVHTGLIAP